MIRSPWWLQLEMFVLFWTQQLTWFLKRHSNRRQCEERRTVKQRWAEPRGCTEAGWGLRRDVIMMSWIRLANSWLTAGSLHTEPAAPKHTVSIRSRTRTSAVIVAALLLFRWSELRVCELCCVHLLLVIWLQLGHMSSVPTLLSHCLPSRPVQVWEETLRRIRRRGPTC